MGLWAGLWEPAAVVETGEHWGLGKLYWDLGDLQRLGGVEVQGAYCDLIGLGVLGAFWGGFHSKI